MLGRKHNDTPQVLESNENTNIFLYIVDHGSKGYLPFDDDQHFTAKDFAQIFEKMYEQKKYRQVFVMVEICFGESLGANLKVPGVLYFTGAAKNEQSFAITYDTQLKSWLSDDFSNTVIKTISQNPQIYLNDLYTQVYEKVTGSHVRLKNFENFGDVTTTPVSDFLSP